MRFVNGACRGILLSEARLRCALASNDGRVFVFDVGYVAEPMVRYCQHDLCIIKLLTREKGGRLRCSKRTSSSASECGQN